MKRRNIGPWILGAVVVICATVCVVTGHEEAVGKGLAIVVIGAMLVFMCMML